MIRKRLILLTYFFLITSFGFSQKYQIDSSQKKTLYPNIEKGSYNVGYKTIIDFDYSRPYNLKYPNATSFQKKDARPIIINVWYPAEVKKDEKSMNYIDYIKVQNHDSTLQIFIDRIEEYNKVNSSYYMFYRDRLSQKQKKAFSNHLHQPIETYRDAAFINDKFPLVFYHPGLGGTLNDNTILCEYLASHGFVVVTSAFQAEDYREIEVDWDLERSIKDMNFILNAIKTLPFINFSKIAAIGHSYGAQAVLGYQAEASALLTCLILLDSTMDYSLDANPDDFELLTEKVYANNEKINVPMLVFANPGATFKVIDSLKNSDRIYTKVKLKHNEFTSLSSFAVLKNLQNRSNKELVWNKYALIDNYCLKYLNYYFFNDVDAKNFILSKQPIFNDVHEIPREKSLNTKITVSKRLKNGFKNAIIFVFTIVESIFN
jgi:hypothetical protein